MIAAAMSDPVTIGDILNFLKVLGGAGAMLLIIIVLLSIAAAANRPRG